MGRHALVWVVAIATLAIASPAWARLGDSIASFKNSRLLGETKFRFDGRTGSSWQFCGATYCEFGQGLLDVDTANGGVIVQESLVMALPEDDKDERELLKITKLFLVDTGIHAPARRKALDAFTKVYETGQPVGMSLTDSVEMHARCDVNLGDVLLVIGLKPDTLNWHAQ